MSVATGKRYKILCTRIITDYTVCSQVARTRGPNDRSNSAGFNGVCVVGGVSEQGRPGNKTWERMKFPRSQVVYASDVVKHRRDPGWVTYASGFSSELKEQNFTVSFPEGLWLLDLVLVLPLIS